MSHQETVMSQPQPPLQSDSPLATHRHQTSERLQQVLEILQSALPATTRRLVRAGDTVYRGGDELNHLFLVRSGLFKTTTQAPDGREQVMGVHFKGDWLGFDGICERRFRGDARALDVGEVWAVPYPALLGVCAAHPVLLSVLHDEMSRQLGRFHETMMARCSLPADARVADFLRSWAESLDERGLRTDRIQLRLSRAEIGNYLGLTLETVSRALSRLARDHLIGFDEHSRRGLHIPDVGALARFVEQVLQRADPQAKVA
jgi:CRP/FNR family transcriptional regulator